MNLLNTQNKTKETKRVKLMQEATNDSISMYMSMVDAIDGCSTPEELMILLKDCTSESLQMKHVENKYLLFIACQHIGYETVALKLWELYPYAAIDQDGWENHRNPLHIASSEGRIDIATQLLEDAEAFLNMPDANGQTPLFYASKKNNVTLANILLNTQDINVNVQDKNGQTALHISCLHLSYGVIELLLNNSNVN